MKKFRNNTNLNQVYLELYNRLNLRTENAQCVKSVFTLYGKVDDYEIRKTYLRVLTYFCDKFDKSMKSLSPIQKCGEIMNYIENRLIQKFRFYFPITSQNNEEQTKIYRLLNSHIYCVMKTMFKIERKKYLPKEKH